MAKQKLKVASVYDAGAKCCPRCYRMMYNAVRVCPSCEHVFYEKRMTRNERKQAISDNQDHWLYILRR